jgi:hypothetical protein
VPFFLERPVVKNLRKRLIATLAASLPAAALVLSPVLAASAQAKSHKSQPSSIQKTSAHKSSHKTKPAVSSS